MINLLQHQFALALLLLLRHRVSGSDCQRWHNAIEFWSNVTCSMEDTKTVNFHSVLESGESFLGRCFQAFVYDIARKCETAIVSRIYTLRDTDNLTFSDVVRPVERPPIWKVASSGEDAIPFRVMGPAGKTRIRSDETCDRNTWNMHVILARDIRSFDQISRDDTTFEWNPHDRFIVLIARLPERHGSSNESNSRIDDILETLWSKRKVQKIFVSEAIFRNDAIQIDRIVRTYNPFAKVNDSVWGKVETINVKTAEEASNVLSHLIYRRTKNLNEYELKVGYFNQGQTLAKPIKVQSNMYHEHADIFKGFDEIMLKTIAGNMNFKMEHVHPRDNKWYGYGLPNGTYVGAIASLHRRHSTW